MIKNDLLSYFYGIGAIIVTVLIMHFLFLLKKKLIEGITNKHHLSN